MSLLADIVHLGASDDCNNDCNVHQPHAPDAQERPQPCIVRVPAATVEVREERVGCLSFLRVLAVQALRQDANVSSRVLRRRGVRSRVESVLGRHEHGTRREHDSGVVEDVVYVEGDETADDLFHEWVSFRTGHEVVTDADRDSLGEGDLEPEERVDVAVATNVEVHVNTPVVVQDEVADSVCALDVVLIPVEGGEEPGIVLCNELSGHGVGP